METATTEAPVTDTPETEEAAATPVAEAKPERSSPEPQVFATAWNDVADGKAVYTETSAPSGSIKRVTVGAKVPKTRTGVAALLNMEYNAVVNRERGYREKGVKLKDLEAGKRGATLDVEAINAALADQEKENAVADAATAE